MKYTVRYAHLESIPDLALNAIVSRGDIIGRIGTSGMSTAVHLHIGCVHCEHRDPWRMSQVESFELVPALEQMAYFVDDELFEYPIVITSYFADPAYLKQFKKLHMGYDVVPEDRHESDLHFNIRWNRSMEGTVIAKGYDSGYGNYVHILFET